VVPLRTLTAGNGARAHGARAKAGTQYFFLSFFPTTPALGTSSPIIICYIHHLLTSHSHRPLSAERLLTAAAQSCSMPPATTSAIQSYDCNGCHGYSASASLASCCAVPSTPAAGLAWPTYQATSESSLHCCAAVLLQDPRPVSAACLLRWLEDHQNASRQLRAIAASWLCCLAAWHGIHSATLHRQASSRQHWHSTAVALADAVLQSERH
jgi:hypothetical protein